MKTLRDVLDLSADYLEVRSVERPKRLVEELLSELLGCRRLDLYLRLDYPLEEAELHTLRGWLQRVVKGEPIQYIFGEMEFFGAHLKVDSRALIPRLETEWLVEWVSKRIQGTETVLDLCTGSGCIAISLKRKFPSLNVFASDLSEKALELAYENSRRNQVDIHFLKGDFLEPFVNQKADWILCNPPYVSEAEYVALDRSVKNYEPRMALEARLEGLEFYKRLAQAAPQSLNPKGKLFLEMGCSQGPSIQEIFSSSDWRHQEIIRDLSGKDRFFFLESQ